MFRVILSIVESALGNEVVKLVVTILSEQALGLAEPWNPVGFCLFQIHMILTWIVALSFVPVPARAVLIATNNDEQPSNSIFTGTVYLNVPSVTSVDAAVVMVFS